MTENNKAIKFVEDIEHRTARCPAMCTSEQSALRLSACVKGANEAIHAILNRIKEHLFDPMTLTYNGGSKVITMFDIYCTGIEKEFIGVDGKYSLSYNGQQYSSNACIGLYPTRELLNPKAQVLGTRDDYISIVNDAMSFAINLAVETPATFINECVFTKVDGMMKGYTNRVAMLSKAIGGHSDSKWVDAVRDASKKSGLGVLEAGIVSRVLCACGPQVNRAMNGMLPNLQKVFGKEMNKVLNTKIYEEAIAISYSTFDNLSESAKRVYDAAIEMFKKSVVENVPNPSKVIPLTVPSISVDRNAKIDSTYFDWKVTIRGIPGGTVDVLIRAHSDKGTNYYPDNIFAFSKEFPKGTFVFNGDIDATAMVCNDMNHPGIPPMTLNIPYEVNKMVPSLNKEDIPKVDLEKTVGMDAGIAVAGLVTSLDSSHIGKDVVDWHEAVHAFHKFNPGAYLFTQTATKSTRDDLKRLSDEYETGKYNMIAMLTIALRDGSPTSEKYNWIPVADPCARMFAWMKRRTNADGSPFYNERQIAIIGHTRTWRSYIRKLIANRRHYFFEQSKWDKNHNTMTEPFSVKSSLAAELNHDYAVISERIRVESTYILSCELLNSEAFSQMDIVSMENLNLNEVEKNGKFCSLYSTIAREWHMGPKDGCKLSSSKNSNTAVIDFGHDITVDEIKSMCHTTKHWNIPSEIKIDGTVATLYCEPTKEGARCRDTEWSDNYTKNAMHIALLKHDSERILTRKGILYKEVSAKKTSQTCHECGHSKCGQKGQKLTAEQCLTKKLNFRDGRVFICGNPNCRLHNQIQNADVNASLCIRNRVKFKDNEFVNSLSKQ